ncbi:MAG: Fic family protein [Chloroflexota bacterium]|nr:Fic family protein [Chloroflexota bacterium]
MSDLWAVGGLPLPVEAEGIWEGVLHEETHHSTAIEGNTLVLRQVKALLEQGRAVGNKELREYLEIEGYADAARWVYAQAIRRTWESDPLTRTRVDIGELREIHRRTVQPAWGLFPPDPILPGEGPGALRQSEIHPLRPGLTPPMAVEIHAEVTDWIESVNSDWPEGEHFVEALAQFHASFERIHPFRDGNGRVGRLVMNLLLVRAGAPPAIIYRQDRAKYLRGLAKADGGDAGPLGELIARAVRHSIERFVLPALAGPHRLVPLASLATPDLSRLALLSAAKRDRLKAVRLSDQWYSNRKWVNDYRRSRRQGRRSQDQLMLG